MPTVRATDKEARRGAGGSCLAVATLALALVLPGPVTASPLSERTPILLFTGKTASLPLAHAPLTLPNGRQISAATLFSAASGSPLEPTGLYAYDLTGGSVRRFESAGGLRASMLGDKPAVFGVCVRAPSANARFLRAPAGQSLATLLAVPGTLAVYDPEFPCDNGIGMVASGTPPDTDATPPVLTLPADISATASSPAGVAVFYAASAIDARDGAVPVSCNPISGSVFPLGQTLVNCNAADAAGNTATGNFRVTVICKMKGDLDADCDVDRNDLNLLTAALGKLASGPNDPRDLDGDGRITTLDARKLVLLCTRPQCATQ